MSDSADPDRDREELADQADPQPERSRTYRFMRWLGDHTLHVIAGVALTLFAATAIFEWSIPRSARIIGLSFGIFLVLLGRPVAKKAKDLLWDPNLIWIVDIDAAGETDEGIYNVPSQRFREWSVEDGSLDWATPNLAFAENVDLEAQQAEGTWRGTMSGRELMQSMQAVRECRGQLEKDAKRGFAIEAQLWQIVQSATRSAVRRVNETFKEATLPDHGDGISAAIDDSLEQFGVEDSLVDSDDDDPESDVPGVSLEFDDLSDLADSVDGGAPSDD